MKTEYHAIAGIGKDELEKVQWPINPVSVSYLIRIGLHRIIGMGWTKADDGQLVNLTIDFEPK